MAEKDAETGLPWSITDFGSSFFFAVFSALSFKPGDYLPSKDGCGGIIKLYGKIKRLFTHVDSSVY